MPLALVRAGPMRHLSVPSSMTQQTIDILRESGWLHTEHRVRPYDDGRILIPLNDNTPSELPSDLANFPIIDTNPIPWNNRESWQARFTELAGEGVLENIIVSKTHEILGDLLIQRHDEVNDQYLPAFIQSKMETHPRIRLMLLDHGVKGEFRIRDLQPIAVRTNRLIWGKELEGLESNLLDPTTDVPENGLRLRLNPSRVYFSSKLQYERQNTTKELTQFSVELGRPINICDPFCGVGPAIAPLLRRESLVGDLLVNDLNPDCLPFLFHNLKPLRGLELNFPQDNLVEPTSGIFVGCMDATQIPSIKDQCGRWDALLVNLPHQTLRLLPALLPLLRPEGPMRICGWTIIPESEVIELPDKLSRIVDCNVEDIEVRVRKQFNATDMLAAFIVRR